MVAMRIGVIGAGNIGQTLKAMLASVDGVTEVTLADNAGLGDVHVDVDTGENLSAFVRAHDAIVNALPFYLNKTVASACAEARRSYFDFSEDVEFYGFRKRSRARREGDRVRPAVRASPRRHQHHRRPSRSAVRCCTIAGTQGWRTAALGEQRDKYYLSWSSSGLVNEYIKPCDALFRGKPVKTLPLDGKENLVIDGVTYEAFNTSGGVATMCETYRDRIGELNYKTIRYPGHLDHMRFVVNDLGLGDRPDLLARILIGRSPQRRRTW